MVEKNLVVITGVTKGIGLGLVGEFIRCGWRVAGCGRSVKIVQELPQGLIAVTLSPGTSNTDMLYKALPEEAGQYPTAEERAKIIVPYILNIKPCDSGKHLSLDRE